MINLKEVIRNYSGVICRIIAVVVIVLLCVSYIVYLPKPYMSCDVLYLSVHYGGGRCNENISVFDMLFDDFYALVSIDCNSSFEYWLVYISLDFESVNVDGKVEYIQNRSFFVVYHEFNHGDTLVMLRVDAAVFDFPGIFFAGAIVGWIDAVRK